MSQVCGADAIGNSPHAIMELIQWMLSEKKKRILSHKFHDRMWQKAG
jgi:hypothetical protein